MTDDRRRRAEELFQVAVDLPVESRADYVGEHCGSDAKLRAEVEKLLRVHARVKALEPPPLLPVEEEPLVDEPAPESDRTGSVIAKYKVERKLGMGGMGMVYLAEDRVLGRKAAIKLLPDQFSSDPLRLGMLAREARTAAHLNHPNIATIYDFDEFDDSYFIAMEYVEGRLLADLLEGSEPVPLLDLLDIAVQIAAGLTAAHEANVVHRDLKPRNIMITEESLVKILDFGLAKALRSEAQPPARLGEPTDSQEISMPYGTPGYSSPEQCAGGEVDLSSDLFSFGVVLYELATGVAPFRRGSFEATHQAVQNAEPEPPRILNPDLPQPLSDLILQLLRKRPEDRYASTAEVLKDLQRLKRRAESRHYGKGRRRRQAFLVSGLIMLTLMTFLMRGGSKGLEDDPRYDELTSCIENQDIPKAREVLRALSLEFTHRQLRWLNESLSTAENALLNAVFTEFHTQLASDKDVKDAVARIAWLDEDDPRHLRFDKLAMEAKEAAKQTHDWTVEAHECLQDDLPRVLELLDHLSTMRLDDEAFDPARQAAEDLLVGVLHKFEGESVAHGLSLSELDDLIQFIRRGEQVLDTGPIVRMREELTLKLLCTSVIMVGPLMGERALGKTHDAMEDVNPDHPITRWTGHYHGRRRAYASALLAFSHNNAAGLNRAIEEYEAHRLVNRRQAADQPLEALLNLQAFLERLSQAENEAIRGDPQEAVRILPSPPPGICHDDAERMRTDLHERAMTKIVSNLERRIARWYELLQFDEAEKDWSKVQELAPLADVAFLKERLLRRSDQYDNDWSVLDLELRLLLEALQDMNASAASQLARLEDVARSLKQEIDQALLHNSDLEAEVYMSVQDAQELTQRRIKLNLILGLYAVSPDDAARLELTAEGLWLLSVARLAEKPEDQGTIEHALKRMDEVSASEDSLLQDPAQYLRGACRHELQREGSLEDLLAINEPELQSADACRRIALIYLKRDKFDLAVTWAANVQRATLTWYEVVVSHGGLRKAVEEAAIHRSRADMHFQFSMAHLRGGQFEKAADPLRQMIELGGGSDGKLSEIVEEAVSSYMRKLAKRVTIEKSDDAQMLMAILRTSCEAEIGQIVRRANSSPLSPRLSLRRDRLRMRLGQYGMVIRDLEDNKDAWPEHAEVERRLLSATALLGAGGSGVDQRKRARDELRIAVALNPDEYQLNRAYQLLWTWPFGSQHKDEGSLRKARSDLESAMHDSHLESADVFLVLANIANEIAYLLRKQEKEQAAAEFYAEAHDRAGSALEASFTEEGIYLVLGGFTSGLAPACARFQAKCHCIRAIASWGLNRFEECLIDCQRALALDESYTRTYYVCGLAHEELGWLATGSKRKLAFEKACYNYKQYLRQHSDGTWADSAKEFLKDHCEG